MKIKTSMDIEQIYYRFRGQIKDFILKRVRDNQIAEDIVQDVFLKIHNRIESLRDKGKLESWVYQIARNAINDHFRQAKTLPLADDNIPEDVSDKDDEIFHNIAQGLEPMIDALPDHYREAILLTEFRGLTQKEMADELGISLSGAKSRVQRARHMLKHALLRCCHFEFDRFGKIIDYYPVACPCCPDDKEEI